MWIDASSCSSDNARLSNEGRRLGDQALPSGAIRRNSRGRRSSPAQVRETREKARTGPMSTSVRERSLLRPQPYRPSGCSSRGLRRGHHHSTGTMAIRRHQIRHTVNVAERLLSDTPGRQVAVYGPALFPVRPDVHSEVNIGSKNRRRRRPRLCSAGPPSSGTGRSASRWPALSAQVSGRSHAPEPLGPCPRDGPASRRTILPVHSSSSTNGLSRYFSRSSAKCSREQAMDALPVEHRLARVDGRGIRHKIVDLGLVQDHRPAHGTQLGRGNVTDLIVVVAIRHMPSLPGDVRVQVNAHDHVRMTVALQDVR